MVWLRPNAVSFLLRLVLFVIVSPGVAARTVVHVGSQLSGIPGNTIGQEGGEVHNVRNGLDQTTALTDSIVRRGAGYGAVTLVAAEIHHGWPPLWVYGASSGWRRKYNAISRLICSSVIDGRRSARCRRSADGPLARQHERLSGMQ